MILNHRTAFTLLACLAILASLSLAPVASAGYEGCSSICTYRPPSAGCSCSNPYFNTTCAYYAQYGCTLLRTDQPAAADPLSQQPELSCETAVISAPAQPMVEIAVPVTVPLTVPLIVPLTVPVAVLAAE